MRMTIKTITILLVMMMAALSGVAGEYDRTDKELKELMSKKELKIATFAGGCFWCTEADFEKLEGVVEAVSGYAGGSEENPTYYQVASGETGHLEAVQVFYDPTKVDYTFLLDWFWRHIDPTDAEGSFVDRGHQYSSAIFYHDEEQKKMAEESRDVLEASGIFSKPIATVIRPLEAFYPAEDYHQDYHDINSVKYNFYRYGSGRDDFLSKTWGDRKNSKSLVVLGEYVKPDNAELKKILTPLQYKVTQEEGTERAFENEYWDNKEEGIYVDILSGEPLFSSTHKYKSGTGWPSYTQPIDEGNLIFREDNSLFSTRTEVRSRQGDNHLGHVFEDGPQPTGLRYCINSAALRFVPRHKLDQEGYGKFLDLF